MSYPHYEHIALINILEHGLHSTAAVFVEYETKIYESDAAECDLAVGSSLLTHCIPDTKFR